MKKIKAITAAFLCLLMVFGGYSTVYANEGKQFQTEVKLWI